MDRPRRPFTLKGGSERVYFVLYASRHPCPQLPSQSGRPAYDSRRLRRDFRPSCRDFRRRRVPAARNRAAHARAARLHQGHAGERARRRLRRGRRHARLARAFRRGAGVRHRSVAGMLARANCRDRRIRRRRLAAVSSRHARQGVRRPRPATSRRPISRTPVRGRRVRIHLVESRAALALAARSRVSRVATRAQSERPADVQHARSRHAEGIARRVRRGRSGATASLRASM